MKKGEESGQERRLRTEVKEGDTTKAARPPPGKGSCLMPVPSGCHIAYHRPPLPALWLSVTIRAMYCGREGSCKSSRER